MKFPAARASLGQVQVILRSMPTYDGSMHYGSRLDGALYVVTDEAAGEIRRITPRR